MESEVANFEHKNLSGSADKELGYSVTYKMNEYIHTLLLENSPMRQIANVMEISTDSLALLCHI